MIRTFNKVKKYLFITLILFVLFPKNAYGYLDPGTGTYILQIVIACALGGAFAIKIFWKKIISMFKSMPFVKKKNTDV
ncbi:hypothetical protein ACFL6D_05585 [Spirochaetota bacterium]